MGHCCNVGCEKCEPSENRGPMIFRTKVLGGICDVEGCTLPDNVERPSLGGSPIGNVFFYLCSDHGIQLDAERLRKKCEYGGTGLPSSCKLPADHAGDHERFEASQPTPVPSSRVVPGRAACEFQDCEKDSGHFGLCERQVPPLPPLGSEKVNGTHYVSGKIESIEVIEAFKLGFNLANAVKYILRADRKGQRDSDLEKAINYLHRERFGTWWKS